MTRLVLDTNSVVSGMFWKGSPHLLMSSASGGRVRLVSSEPLLLELEDVLRRRKISKIVAASGLSIHQLLQEYVSLAEIVSPIEIPRTVPDPDDDVVLGTAIAGNADYVVTGDYQMLHLREFRGVPILSAAEVQKRMLDEPTLR